MTFWKRLFRSKTPEPVKQKSGRPNLSTHEAVGEWPGDPEEFRSKIEWSQEITRLRKIDHNNIQSEIQPLIKRASAPHRQLLFMLRKAQHELRRQQKFLDDAEKFLMKIEEEYTKD